MLWKVSTIKTAINSQFVISFVLINCRNTKFRNKVHKFVCSDTYNPVRYITQTCCLIWALLSSLDRHFFSRSLYIMYTFLGFVQSCPEMIGILSQATLNSPWTDFWLKTQRKTCEQYYITCPISATNIKKKHWVILMYGNVVGLCPNY